MVLGIGNSVEIIIRARDMFSKVFSRASLGLKSFRKAAMSVAAVGAIIAFGFVKAIGATIELETAMVDVAKTTGLSGKKIEVLRQEFIQLSTVMPVAAEELATIGAVAGQLGIQGVENIRSFTEVAAKMAIATELNAEQAALAMAKISNAMGLPISEAEKLGSAINELSNISAASSSEIVGAMVRVAGSANTLGLTTDVVAGMTAALIAAGEPAFRAGTKLRSAFDTIVKKLESDVIPLMGEDFPDAIRNDANAAILSLIKRVSEIKDPIERQQTALKVFGTVGASAINKLANNIPEMNRLIAASSEQFENATSLQNEYNRAIESSANQIQLLKNQFSVLAFELGDQLIPIIRDVLIPTARKVIDFFRNLPEPVKQAIIVLGLVTIAVGILAGTIALLTLASTPWLLIIGGIILAITGLILLILSWQKVLDFLSIKFVQVAAFMDSGWEMFKDAFIIALSVMENTVIKVWNSILDFIGKKIQKAIDFINMLISAANRLPKINIGFIPDIDLSSIRGSLTDIGALKLRLENERMDRAGRFDALANRFGSNTVVNIESVNGLDPDEIAQALQDKLKNVGL